MIENFVLSVESSIIASVIRLVVGIVVGIGSYRYFKKKFLRRKNE